MNRPLLSHGVAVLATCAALAAPAAAWAQTQLDAGPGAAPQVNTPQDDGNVSGRTRGMVVPSRPSAPAYPQPGYPQPNYPQLNYQPPPVYQAPIYPSAPSYPRAPSRRYDPGQTQGGPDWRYQPDAGPGANPAVTQHPPGTPGYGHPELYRGGRLPRGYWDSRQSYIDDWYGYGLPRPGRRQQWVQVGGDYVLIDLRSGAIQQVVRP